MSEENVDLVKESIERFNRDDVAGALRYFHPEIRFEHRLAELRGDLTGIDAVRDWFVDATEHFDRWMIDCDDFRDLGDRVLALGTVRAFGKESGVEVEMPFTVVVTLQDGLVTHYTDYGDSEIVRKASKPPGCGSRRPLLWTKSSGPLQCVCRTISRILGRW